MQGDKMDSREFFYNFGKIIYRIDGYYSEFAKKENVKANLLWIMYALSDNKPHTQKEICNEWDLPLTTINTIIKDLEKQKLVKLLKIGGKKREMNITLTKEGQNFSDRLLVKLFDLEKQVFTKIEKNADNLILELEEFEKEINKVFQIANQ